VASAIAPPVTAKTTTSVDPLYAAAVAQAKAALAAETAPIQNEQAASDANFKQQQTDTTGAAAAVQKLLKPIGPAVNGEYQTAAQNQELAANGFSHGMQDALQGNTDNLNAFLKQLGNPVTLDSHAQEAGDATYALGGYNPGVAFSKQGAAFGAAADLQSGDALLKGQQNVADLKAKAIVADQGFQAKIEELAGKLPGDIQTNYQHLQTLALSDARFREQVANDKFNQSAKIAEEKLAQLKYSADVQYKNANLKLSSQRLAIEGQRLANSQFNADRNYALALGRLRVANTTMQMKITANAFKAANGGFTKAAITKFVLQANAAANLAWNGTSSSTSTSTQAYDAAGNPVGTKSGSRVTSTNKGARQPYFQALAGMMKKGVPVQIGMDALDAVYPSNARPSPDAILQTLGPLAPQSIHDQIIKGAVTAPGYDAKTAAGLVITDPQALLTQAAPAVKPIKTAAFHMAQNYGWSDSANLNALDLLWTRESGWNPAAKNPSSGALGIPQELGHQVPANYASDAGVQIKWGLDYIHGRYGSPLAAWSHEQKFGWY
jgi:hypothetical protein